VNDMLRELQEDMTLGHLRENWFNATSPCMEVEMRGERGEGSKLELLDVWVFFALYFLSGVVAIFGKIIQDQSCPPSASAISPTEEGIVAGFRSSFRGHRQGSMFRSSLHDVTPENSSTQRSEDPKVTMRQTRQRRSELEEPGNAVPLHDLDPAKVVLVPPRRARAPAHMAGSEMPRLSADWGHC
jgi:hypothetical protein